MKYIAENIEDMLKLAQMLVHGEITSEEYWESTELLAKGRVKQESEWKPWIDGESIRGDKKSWWAMFKTWVTGVSSK